VGIGRDGFRLRYIPVPGVVDEAAAPGVGAAARGSNATVVKAGAKVVPVGVKARHGTGSDGDGHSVFTIHPH
jgi:hypothetical protein